MRISTINFNYTNSFGAVKIKPTQKNNEKSQAQLLIENANKTINDTTAGDFFEATSKKFYDCSDKMIEKRREISGYLF